MRVLPFIAKKEIETQYYLIRNNIRFQKDKFFLSVGSSKNDEKQPDKDMTTIEVKSLSKSFGKTKAVNNVSFEVERGRIFGLARPQWCGQNHNDPDD
jgi:ABC-type glutathione transport system ATPase component